MFRNSLKMLLTGGKSNRKNRSSDGGNEEPPDRRQASVDFRQSRSGQGTSTENDCAFEPDYAIPPLPVTEGMQHIRIMEGMSRSLPSSPLLTHQSISVRLQPVKKLTAPLRKAKFVESPRIPESELGSPTLSSAQKLDVDAYCPGDAEQELGPPPSVDEAANTLMTRLGFLLGEKVTEVQPGPQYSMEVQDENQPLLLPALALNGTALEVGSDLRRASHRAARSHQAGFKAAPCCSGLVQPRLNNLHGWRLDGLSGQPVPVLDASSCEGLFFF